MSTTRLILAFTILGLCTTGCRFRSPLQKTDTKTSLLEGATTDAKVQSFLVKLQPSMETDLQTQLQLSNQEVLRNLTSYRVK